MNQESQRGVRRLLRGAHPEIRKMLLIADEQNFKIKTTSGCHYKVSSPDPDTHRRGEGSVTLPSTPSDSRSVHNARAQLRRIGVQFEQQKGRRAA